MNHSYNVEVAVKYGVKRALIIDFLYKCYVHDELATLEWLSNYFPYFSKSQIRNYLNKLIKLGVVKSKNDAKNFDHINYYKLSSKFVIDCYTEEYK
jgi:hypothetical protein